MSDTEQGQHAYPKTMALSRRSVRSVANTGTWMHRVLAHLQRCTHQMLLCLRHGEVDSCKSHSLPIRADENESSGGSSSTEETSTFALIERVLSVSSGRLEGREPLANQMDRKQMVSWSYSP